MEAGSSPVDRTTIRLERDGFVFSQKAIREGDGQADV
jgi:hypothetical protein